MYDQIYTCPDPNRESEKNKGAISSGNWKESFFLFRSPMALKTHTMCHDVRGVIAERTILPELITPEKSCIFPAKKPVGKL